MTIINYCRLLNLGEDSGGNAKFFTTEVANVEEVANVSNEVALLPATSDNDKKKERQSQITDFFKTA